MHRGKHNMDESEKSASLLEAAPETIELKLQLQEEIEHERESAALSARRAFACRVVAGGFVILFMILFCFKALSESADQRRSFSSSCMHAIGGGVVGPRGSLLHFDPRCTEELKEYFDQAYYAEVRRVSDEAITYFRQQVARHQQQQLAGAVAPGGNRGTVIFDIDETALSNMDGFFGGSSWSRLFGRESPDRCVRPHLEYDNLEPLRLQLIGQTGQLAPVQPQRRPLCNAPPLRATLDLYNYLYDNNFTVVFLTGRSEDARAETEANLADAGYGRRCGADPAVATGAAAGAATAVPDTTIGYPRRRGGRRIAQNDAQSSSSGTSAGWTTMAAMDTGAAAVDAVTGTVVDSTDSLSSSTAASSAASSSSSSTSSASLPFVGLFSPPAAPPARCYADLVMRAEGDQRLASVFKAEARVRLVAEGGHVLVGNIGDQFSDLVGQASAMANFKLPNPVYTLL